MAQIMTFTTLPFVLINLFRSNEVTLFTFDWNEDKYDCPADYYKNHCLERLNKHRSLGGLIF